MDAFFPGRFLLFAYLHSVCKFVKILIYNYNDYYDYNIKS